MVKVKEDEEKEGGRRLYILNPGMQGPDRHNNVMRICPIGRFAYEN